jgi:hypothetical protein
MDPFGRLDSWFDELTILSLSKDRADKMPNELGNYKRRSPKANKDNFWSVKLQLDQKE